MTYACMRARVVEHETYAPIMQLCGDLNYGKTFLRTPTPLHSCSAHPHILTDTKHLASVLIHNIPTPLPLPRTPDYVMSTNTTWNTFSDERSPRKVRRDLHPHPCDAHGRGAGRGPQGRREDAAQAQEYSHPAFCTTGHGEDPRQELLVLASRGVQVRHHMPPSSLYPVFVRIIACLRKTLYSWLKFPIFFCLRT